MQCATGGWHLADVVCRQCWEHESHLESESNGAWVKPPDIDPSLPYTRIETPRKKPRYFFRFRTRKHVDPMRVRESRKRHARFRITSEYSRNSVYLTHTSFCWQSRCRYLCRQVLVGSRSVLVLSTSSTGLDGLEMSLPFVMLRVLCIALSASI